MGINLTWVCHTHKRQHTSMRGEEGIDFHYFVRVMGTCPGTCLRNGNITVYHDGYFHDADYEEFFPNWHSRPAEQKKANEEMMR